jgi:FHS family Na+ dependent glucose MFS transporter 1
MAAIMMLRTVGIGVGGIVAGILIDKYPTKLSLWITTISTLVLVISTAIQPLSNLWEIFAVFMFIQGLTVGSLSNSVHTLLLDLWKSTSTGPSMQLIHFTFAVGAFVTPLVSNPFLSEERNPCHLRSKCHIPANYCTSGEGSGLYNESSNICNTTPSTAFQYVFFISVIPLVLALPGLLFYSYKEECCIKSSICMKRDVDEVLKEEEAIKKQEVEETTYPDTKLYAFAMIFLGSCYMFVYMGSEVAFGTFLFTYTVEGKPHFTKKTATILSSLFWGTFSFLRLISMVLTLCKVPPSILLTGNLIGSLIASIVMLIWPESKIATWIGSALMGTSFASVFPNSIVWLSYNAPVNGISIGIVGIAVTTGEALLSTAVGVLIDMIGPASFTYYNLAAVIVSLLLFYAMLGLAQICKVKNSHTAKNYKPLEMEIVNNHTSNNQITLCKSQ